VVHIGERGKVDDDHRVERVKEYLPMCIISNAHGCVSWMVG
jgi:hypothetical protein